MHSRLFNAVPRWNTHWLQIEFPSYSTTLDDRNEVSSFPDVVSTGLGLDNWNLVQITSN